MNTSPSVAPSLCDWYVLLYCHMKTGWPFVHELCNEIPPGFCQELFVSWTTITLCDKFSEIIFVS